MARDGKNLPVDHKWKPENGVRDKNHEYANGEYLETAYQHQEFPKTMFHPNYVHNRKEGIEYAFDQLPQVVNNVDELEQLGPDWKESPAEHNIVTAPDQAHTMRMKKDAAAKGKDWRAAVPGAGMSLTEEHLNYLKAAGADVKTMADMYALVAKWTSAQMQGFMEEVAKAGKEQKPGKGAKGASPGK